MHSSPLLIIHLHWYYVTLNSRISKYTIKILETISVLNENFKNIPNDSNF